MMDFTMSESSTTLLVRYGAIPEVARFANPQALPVDRGADVVVATHRGPELGAVLEELRPSPEPRIDQSPPEPTGEVLRLATDADRDSAARLRREAAGEFTGWEQRIAEWRLDLQLIDLEWTIDRSRLILYVLNDRGPDCAKLALQAAAGGWGVIDVQPVSMDGLVPRETGHGGGGCGSCGCHN
jgi:cell fate regulator YaaT (PSP1 superfamily)